jgi:hypothetical protein
MSCKKLGEAEERSTMEKTKETIEDKSTIERVEGMGKDKSARDMVEENSAMESVKEMTLGKVLERWLGSNFKEMVME